MRRKETEKERAVIKMNVEGKWEKTKEREKGRPKKAMVVQDAIENNDMRAVGVCV